MLSLTLALWAARHRGRAAALVLNSPWLELQLGATHPAWLAAVLSGHRRIAAGVDVGCAVLVLLSARSSSPLAWSEAMTSTDSVLVVEEIARSATRIGGSVTIDRIDGAIHDVFLSRPRPRAAAYRALERWASAYVPGRVW